MLDETEPSVPAIEIPAHSSFNRIIGVQARTPSWLSSSCRAVTTRTNATTTAGATTQTNANATFSDRKPLLGGDPVKSSSESTRDTATSDASASTTATPDSLDTSPPTDTLSILMGRMRGWADLALMAVRERADIFSTQATTTLSQLGGHLNRATGYDSIDILKQQVVEQEARIKGYSRSGSAAKLAYDEAVIQRAGRTTRKSSWSDEDVGRFTALVRADHAREQDEARRKLPSQRPKTRSSASLARSCGQFWHGITRSRCGVTRSGVLRRMGHWRLLRELGGLIAAIVFVEPWKRKRLAQTFERKVEELGAETKAMVDEGTRRIDERLANQERLLAELFSGVAEHVHEVPSTSALVEEQERSKAQEPPRRTFTPHPWFGAVGTREFVLIAGSAVAGGAISLLTRSLFDI
ncbi:Mdm33 family-domain-containing protein [Pisolithus croceorrhizus]|nr:Mdm33 family-domain-containing protein [Pisolithus croceorrhizus]